MVYRIHASDRAAFKHCRRAWDLGSRNRQNFEPIPRQGAIDLNRAIRDALAVYYFPGMWEWNRAIVQPLVHQALEKAVHGQPQADDQSRQEALDRGHALLDAYAAWAPTVDNFTPVRVETDIEVNIPDPASLGADLVSSDLLTPSGEPISYTDRVDLLVIDENDAYWVVQHRLIAGRWTDQDALQLDEQTIMWCWAWPLFYLGMHVAGTVYNEIRTDAGESGREVAARELTGHQQVRHRRMYARSAVVPRERVRAEGTDEFRRTRIPRGTAELGAAGVNLVAEARTVISTDLEIYPTPTPKICSRCPFLPPCLVLNEGGDAAAELARSYRRRPPVQVEEGRLGGATWSMNRGAAPPRWPGDP
ncbi:MAG: hypothetical protein ACRDTC_02345 [Pseudonocardiaceae bacterium]